MDGTGRLTLRNRRFLKRFVPYGKLFGDDDGDYDASTGPDNNP